MPETDKQRFDRLDAMRGPAKVTNYSAMYNVGVKGLSRGGNMSLEEASDFLDAFWKMNWAIKAVAESAYTKKLKDGSLWLYNPISGFFYSLRYEKDIWSTMNQGTGVYVFDKNIGIMRKAGVKFCMQFHDEGAFSLKKGTEDMNDKKLNQCVVELNEALQLHIPMGIDVKYGGSYAAIH